jgi:LPXTG-site transpeptidase (sortase) family protein
MTRMSKLHRKFDVTNLMILAGFILVLIGIGNLVYQYIQNNTMQVLANANEGGGDPNAFIPPLQELATKVPTPILLSGTGVLQTEVATTPQPLGLIPDRLVIPAINLDVPVIPEHYKVITLDGTEFIQWRVPFRRASGWQDITALLGDIGNTVLNGHHNQYGEVFKDLINLKEGDLIEVFSGATIFIYKVDMILLLPEKYQSMEERIQNANWILPTTDERLTMVTCWPPEGNTHRLIIVAFRVKS